MKIYILHGWTYSINKWQPFVNLLKSKNLTPVILKIPGLTEKIDRPWDMNDYVNWLDKKLEKEKNKIILLGHSNGGRISMAFALKYPEKIKNLILIDSTGIYRNELSIILKRAVFKIIANAGKKISNTEAAKKLLYMIAREWDYAKANENMKKTMINLIESDKNLDPRKISNKTLIIWGEKDETTTLGDGEILNQNIVQSKLHIVENARHSPQFTHPKYVAEIILKEI